MTLLGQSRKEDQKPTASIVNPKNNTRIGNWNVRTMFETGKAGQVAREMEARGEEETRSTKNNVEENG